MFIYTVERVCTLSHLYMTAKSRKGHKETGFSTASHQEVSTQCQFQAQVGHLI